MDWIISGIGIEEKITIEIEMNMRDKLLIAIFRKGTKVTEHEMDTQEIE